MSIDPPQIPELTEVNFDDIQRRHLSSMGSTFDDAAGITTRASEKSQESLIAQLERAIPGYRNMVTSAAKNIGDFLSGKVPIDVANRLADHASSRAQAWGMGSGSGMARNLEMRDFGLTSMDAIQKGLDSFNQFSRTQKETSTVQEISPTSLYLSARDRLSHEEQERTSRFNRDLYASEVSAAAARANQQLAMAGNAHSFNLMPPTGATRSWMSNNYQTSVGGLASRRLSGGFGTGRNPISFSNFGAGMGGEGANWTDERDMTEAELYGIVGQPFGGRVGQSTSPPSYGGMPHQGRDDYSPRSAPLMM